MFTRVGAAALKKDLHNTRALCTALKNPQEQFKTVHIGGTNGKGSTSHMLAAIFQAAGYKTGLYTSPHLKDFRERIRINGKMIPRGEVIRFVQTHKGLIGDIAPSFFELTVAMAFDYFARQHVDIAIIEVGLGGRLDSTNIIHPELSVITNISLDHTQILGDTLQAIAYEKAGIIKTNTPVIIGEWQEETATVFIEKARKEQAPLYFADQLYRAQARPASSQHLSLDIYQEHSLTYSQLKLDLTGSYQLKNSTTVIAACEQLRKRGFALPDTAVYKALSQVKKATGLMGRWQRLGKNPLIMADTGHNEAGIKEVLKNIENTPHQQLHIVMGMVKDKDSSKVLRLLPKKAFYYFCAPQLERALSAADLQAQARRFGLEGQTYPFVAEALAAAKSRAQPQDLIFVGGSTFVVAEII